MRQKADGHVGYTRLVEALNLRVAPLRAPARICPVTRLDRQVECLAVPPNMAPAHGDLMGHLQFALKHEGVNLAILAQALPRIPAERFADELAASPNGIYIRKASFLREAFTGEQLRQAKPVQGGFVALFDPKAYVTGPAARNRRWRVDFNGLGSLSYCATVERTAEIDALLQADIQGAGQRVLRRPAVDDARQGDQLGLHE